jgi:hypothetical protein
MKSKLRPLAILLLAVLAPMSSSAQENPLSTSSPVGQLIESGRSYEGTTVRDLLDAVWNEAAARIRVAYDEGYKAGLLDSYPDAAYWESLSKAMESQAKRQASAPGWGVVLGASGGSLVIGFAAGVVACIYIGLR